MKKTFMIVLAFVCALTLSIVALAEGISENGTEAVAETTEIVAETPDVTATEVEEETAEPETPAFEQAEPDEEFVVYEDEEVEWEPTPEDLAFIYCLNHFNCHYLGEDLHHYVLEYENTGNLDGSVTLLVSYGYDSYNETDAYLTGVFEEPRECADFGMELITIPLPAGEKTVYAFEPGYWYNSMCYGIVGASYGDVSVEEPFMEIPMINNQTVEEHLKGCTHSELVVR